MEKRSTDTIISDLRKIVESKQPLDRGLWLEAAFYLSLLRIDEAQLFNKMNQAVSQKRLEILKGQEKKNVAAADVEVSASDEYRFLKDQEAKLYSVDELIRVAKRNADVTY